MRGLFINLAKTIKFDKKEFQRVLALQGPSPIKSLIDKKYIKKINYKCPNLNNEWQKHLKNFNKDGFVVIDKQFNKHYEKILNNLNLNDLDNYYDNNLVIDYCFDLGFSFPGIYELMTDEQLCSFFCNFLERQAIYRNHPEIVSHSKNKFTKKRSSEFAHIDGYKQITCFLMLSDMDKSTSQLYYYPNSHKKKSFNFNRSKYIENNKEIEPVGICAKKGDLVIFNSGALWHKGFARQSRRLILNFVVTSGWLPTPDEEKYDYDFLKIKLENEENFVKNCFSGFC